MQPEVNTSEAVLSRIFHYAKQGRPVSVIGLPEGGFSWTVGKPGGGVISFQDPGKWDEELLAKFDSMDEFLKNEETT